MLSSFDQDKAIRFVALALWTNCLHKKLIVEDNGEKRVTEYYWTMKKQVTVWNACIKDQSMAYFLHFGYTHIGLDLKKSA